MYCASIDIPLLSISLFAPPLPQAPSFSAANWNPPLHARSPPPRQRNRPRPPARSLLPRSPLLRSTPPRSMQRSMPRGMPRRSTAQRSIPLRSPPQRSPLPARAVRRAPATRPLALRALPGTPSLVKWEWSTTGGGDRERGWRGGHSSSFEAHTDNALRKRFQVWWRQYCRCIHSS